jgi:hypothetical protein
MTNFVLIRISVFSESLQDEEKIRFREKRVSCVGRRVTCLSIIAIISLKNFRQYNIMFSKLYQHHFTVIQQFFSLFDSLRTFFLNDFNVVCWGFEIAALRSQRLYRMSPLALSRGASLDHVLLCSGSRSRHILCSLARKTRTHLCTTLLLYSMIISTLNIWELLYNSFFPVYCANLTSCNLKCFMTSSGVLDLFSCLIRNF